MAREVELTLHPLGESPWLEVAPHMPENLEPPEADLLHWEAMGYQCHTLSSPIYRRINGGLRQQTFSVDIPPPPPPQPLVPISSQFC
jgi:hypothetical protein